MLDPFSALSVAASAVQFIDFTAKLLSKSAQIRRDGSAIDIAYLRARTEDLILLSAGLRAGSDSKGASGYHDEVCKMYPGAITQLTTI